jgi:uncharacterized protein
MRLTALIPLTFALGSTFGNGAAQAFDCTGVTKPSSIVICSDPDLMRIADERQEAVYGARARLSDEQFRALMADQAAWVRTYATTCGVPPESGPPRLPVSSAVKECFRRAGEARAAYLRSYGLAAGRPSALPALPPGSQEPVGPSFDCANAVHPLTLLICADADLARVDLQFNQAYWALAHQLDQSARQGLRDEDVAFIDAVQDNCGVPRSGGLTTQVWRTRDCLKGGYEGQRARWLSRLSGPAYEEATRRAERHVDLQRSLGVLGFLPPAIKADGVYGGQTRSAIIAWQTGRGRTANGFLSEGDANAIEREVMRHPETPPARVREPLGALDEVALIPKGNLFVVPVRINDTITLRFILDSGASDVQIPADVAMTLARAGTILESDFIGSQKYKLADGSELKGEQFKVRELQLGNHVVRNVVAGIGPVQGGLLLGQTCLSRFGRWTIDNTRHVLIVQSPNAD